MARYFDEHQKRDVRELGGAWRFMTDPKKVGEEEGWSKQLPTKDTVTVPSMWNNEMGLLGYEGAAWYEKTFYTHGGCLRLHFGAVMTKADVWFDGEYLGSHYGGFCEFSFIVRDVNEGEHVLTVRADNSFDAHSIPQKQVDWYHYGGINRPVTVEILRGVTTLYNRMEYELNEALDTAECAVVLELYNAEGETVTAPVTVTLGGNKVWCGEVTLAAGETREIKTETFTEKNIALWDMETPNLYDLIITTPTDDLRDRVGFRKIAVEDGKVTLNGRAVEFRGVNRHEEHPDWGFAFPEKLMKRDLDIIIGDLGCNTIRGSHYPNSRTFVDMLDARGVLFWSEIPIWGCGFSQETLGDPIVVERGLEMHREMLHYYYNHPSIVIWGLHNEIKTETPEAYAMTEKYYKYVKANGGNRLVTYASNHGTEDICFEFCDIICLNQYHGWYGGSIESWASKMDSFRAYREQLGFSHKPVIYSEFGGAGLYGHHTFDDVHWTEEYQAKLLSHCLELFHKDPMVVGYYVWQFCDMRTCIQMGLGRARGFNNKGIVNEYRKPKAAYHAIKALNHRFAEEEK